MDVAASMGGLGNVDGIRLECILGAFLRAIDGDHLSIFASMLPFGLAARLDGRERILKADLVLACSTLYDGWSWREEGDRRQNYHS